MAKFTFNSKNKRFSTTQDMKIGQMARIISNKNIDPNYQNLIIIKHFSGFICLSDPSLTGNNALNVDVELLNIGDSVTLTQED